MNELTTYEGLAAISSMRARIDAADMKEYMVAIDAAPKNRRVEFMKQLADQGVASYGTLRRRYYDRSEEHTSELQSR